MKLRRLYVAAVLLTFTGACSQPGSLHSQRDEPSITRKEEVLSRLGEDIFLMCSRPDISGLSAFNVKTYPLPDEATVVRFAAEVFNQVYGSESMQRQQPLRVVRLDYPYADPPGVSRYNGNWVIRGTWNEPPGTKGGTAIMIASPNGEILCLTHGK